MDRREGGGKLGDRVALGSPALLALYWPRSTSVANSPSQRDNSGLVNHVGYQGTGV